jgi:cytochrome c peroxidase
MPRRHLISVCLCVFWAAAAGQQSAFQWDLPGGWPAPAVPADNPITPARVALGRFLFYDTRLSGNGTQSCASCHQQTLAFTDGRAQAVGSTGEHHTRSSMSLVNIAYGSTLTWAHPTLTRLEEQALVPMFGDRPVELGLRRDSEEGFLAKLREVPVYRRLFPDAFGPAPDPFTVTNATRALASFERTIISFPTGRVRGPPARQ